MEEGGEVLGTPEPGGEAGTVTGVRQTPTRKPKIRLRRSEKGLVCLIQALMGMQVIVELRKDVTISGVLDECDDAMNVMIKDATTEDVEGVRNSLPMVFVRGHNIRFVHIPKSVAVSEAIEARRLMLDKAAHAYLGGSGQANASAAGSSSTGKGFPE